jgi:hypothetical protein
MAQAQEPAILVEAARAGGELGDLPLEGGGVGDRARFHQNPIGV